MNASVLLQMLAVALVAGSAAGGTMMLIMRLLVRNTVADAIDAFRVGDVKPLLEMVNSLNQTAQRLTDALVANEKSAERAIDNLASQTEDLSKSVGELSRRLEEQSRELALVQQRMQMESSAPRGRRAGDTPHSRKDD